ncbi:hypothetical protein [Streptomyces sp. NBC_00258]|uniref:hypothetical protein n=1 Tax=Streptomyces sp. NBC_00258 TaxID=2903642 RepID=UPI002E2E4F13|nr:hypothetical protein [Streptomyces sp. NBC_00258]
MAQVARRQMKRLGATLKAHLDVADRLPRQIVIGMRDDLEQLRINHHARRVPAAAFARRRHEREQSAERGRLLEQGAFAVVPGTGQFLPEDDVRPVRGEDAMRQMTRLGATSVVRSARGALPALPLVGFPGPPSEPGVPVSGHRALHKSRSGIL